MTTMNNAPVAAQIVKDLLSVGYTETSDFIRGIKDAEAVHVDGDDCCLIVGDGRADFYFLHPFAAVPRWGYKHSYSAPRRPHDAGRYLAHGREVMRQDGWKC